MSSVPRSRASLGLALAAPALACTFSGSGLTVPNDPLHRGSGFLAGDDAYIPDRLSMRGNAFESSSLLRPPSVTGGSQILANELLDFAATQKEDMCYWSFQPLPPPKGDGPEYWDVSTGQWDEDLEWVLALANAASRRLKRIQDLSGGVLVGTMCADGRDNARRRCENGRAGQDSWTDSCSDARVNANLRWGQAITIWKLQPQKGKALGLKDWVRYWRSNASFGHTPNIQWTYRGGSQETEPWNGGAPLPDPFELDPAGEPHGPEEWPASKGEGWGGGTGSAMLAKVLPCSQVPSKFQDSQEQHYCDHVSEGETRTTADEAYEAWQDVVSLWPPTKPCADDVAALNARLAAKGSELQFDSCDAALSGLESSLANFNCDAIWSGYGGNFRDFCCSVCGGEPVPDLPAPPPAPTPSGTRYFCTVCGHEYDATEDGQGQKKFTALPDSWTCPICGMPKSAYEVAASEVELV